MRKKIEEGRRNFDLKVHPGGRESCCEADYVSSQRHLGHKRQMKEIPEMTQNGTQLKREVSQCSAG